MTENEEFAKMVREVIFYHNINQSQLAEKLGCKQSYISDVKRGKKPVSDKIMENLRKIWEEVKADKATKSSEDSTMKQRMNEFLAYLDMSQGKFEKAVGMANGWVNKIGDSIREDNLKKISEVYPMLNIAWLKTGVGSMLNNGESEETLYTPKEEHSQTTESEDTAKWVLLLPVSAQGGSLNDFVVSVKESDCEKVVSPIRGVDFAMTVSGDSMSPEYPNGSRIFIKKINERAFIEWGKVYVLDTCNGTVIKILVPSDKEGYVKCVSINTDPIFAPFEVAFEDIYGVYKVLLCMSVK